MIEAFFLVVFWLVPLQIVMAVMAERIGKSKGMRNGDAFFKTLFLGYGEFVEVCDAPAKTSQFLFQRPFAARMLELVLMFTGTAVLPLTVLLLSYCIPGQIGDQVSDCALFFLCMWDILATVAIGILARPVARELKTLTAEERLTGKELAILRNLLIPSLIPLVIVDLVVFVLIGILIALGLVKLLLTGLMDGTTVLLAISGCIALVSAFAVSPLLCYELARQKQRSVALWVPVGFILPVIAPITLFLMKGDGHREGASDWKTAMMIHALSATAFGIMMVLIQVTNFSTPLWIRPWLTSLIPTWTFFAFLIPFAGTQALKVVPAGPCASRLTIRAAGIQSFSLGLATLLSFIHWYVHSTRL